MPLWLIKLLPYGVAALALFGAVWFIHHDGYKRAQDQAKLTDANRKVELAAVAILLRDKTAQQTQDMQDIVTRSDINLSDRIGDLQLEQKTIVQPTLIKEIASDPRFSDPNAGISDGMLRGLNTARGASARPCPTGSNATACFTLPVAEPTSGQGDRNAGNGGQ